LWYWSGTSWIPLTATPTPPPYQYYRRRFLGTQNFISGTIATLGYNQPDSAVLRNTAVPILAPSGSGISVNTQCVIRASGQIELNNNNLYSRYAAFFGITPVPGDIIAIQSEAFYEPGGSDGSVRLNVVSPPILVVAGTIIDLQVEDTANAHPNTIVSGQFTVEVVSL
jgi:hypothetical protein